MIIYSTAIFTVDTKIEKETILEDFLIPGLFDEIKKILIHKTKLDVKERNPYVENLKEYLTGVDIIIKPLSVSEM